jgi:hypothetical protein
LFQFPKNLVNAQFSYVFVGQRPVMLCVALGSGSEDRLGQFLAFSHSRGQADIAGFSSLSILRPRRAREIASDNAFYRYALGFSHKHRAADKGIRQLSRLAREIPHLAQNDIRIDYLDEMVEEDMGCFIEPEGGKFVEDSSFVRDAAWQDNIEGRDAVGGHDEESITYVINVPYLAPPKQRQR